MTEYTLRLIEPEVNAILAVLGEVPTKSGFWPLVLKIQEQAQAQKEAADAAATAAG